MSYSLRAGNGMIKPGSQRRLAASCYQAFGRRKPAPSAPDWVSDKATLPDIKVNVLTIIVWYQELLIDVIVLLPTWLSVDELKMTM